MPAPIEARAVLTCLTPPDVFRDPGLGNQASRVIENLQGHFPAVLAHRTQARAAKWQAVVLTDASDYQIHCALTTLSTADSGDLAIPLNAFSASHFQHISVHLDQNIQKLSTLELPSIGYLKTLEINRIRNDAKQESEPLEQEYRVLLGETNNKRNNIGRLEAEIFRRQNQPQGANARRQNLSARATFERLFPEMKNKNIQDLNAQLLIETRACAGLHSALQEIITARNLVLEKMTSKITNLIHNVTSRFQAKDLFSSMVAIHLRPGGNAFRAANLVRLTYGTVESQSTSEHPGKNILFESVVSIEARSEAYLRRSNLMSISSTAASTSASELELKSPSKLKLDHDEDFDLTLYQDWVQQHGLAEFAPPKYLPPETDFIISSVPALLLKKSTDAVSHEQINKLELRTIKSLDTMLIKSGSPAILHFFRSFIKIIAPAVKTSFTTLSEFKLIQLDSALEPQAKPFSIEVQNKIKQIDYLSAGTEFYRYNDPRRSEKKDEEVHSYHQLRARVISDLPDQALGKIIHQLKSEAQLYLSPQRFTITRILASLAGISSDQIPEQRQLSFSDRDQADNDRSASWFNARQLLVLSGKILRSSKDAPLTTAETLQAVVDLIYQQAATHANVQLPDSFRSWLLSSPTFTNWIEKIAGLYVPSMTLKHARNLV